LHDSFTNRESVIRRSVVSKDSRKCGNSKHVIYEPITTKDDTNEWFCPKCGCSQSLEPGFDFYIEENFGEEGCELLHEDDYIICTKCGYETTGKKYVAQLLKKKNMVTCPCCKGQGAVSKETAEKYKG
jgi:hypothetical protein